MRRAMSFVLTVLVLFFLSPSALAQTITLDEFLTLLIETHPVFTSERLAAEIAAEEQAGLLGAEDWRAFSSATLAHEQPAFAGFGPENTTTISLGGGLERTIWRTGGRVSSSVSLSFADLDIDPFLGYPESYYLAGLGVSYAHPLVKNKGGTLDRLAYELKGYDVRSAEATALEVEEDFLAAAAAKFLDWVYLTEQNGIFSERLRLSQEELARTVRKRDAYLIDEADVIRAEDAVRYWEQTLVLGEAQWGALRAELSVLAQHERLLEMTPAYGLYEVAELPPLPSASAALAQDSRLLRDLGIRLEQLHHVRLGYEETAKPDLMLVAELNTEGAHEEILESLWLDKPKASLSVRFGLPLKNTTANSNVARTDLEIRRLETTMEDVTLALQSGLSAVHTQMTALDSVLVLNRGQIESAKRRTDEELELYNNGRGELTFVIQSRDNEQQARLTHAQNALTYHKLLVTYRALMDELHN